MAVLVGVGNELAVEVAGDVGLPVVGEAGEGDSAEKHCGEDEDGGQGLQSAAMPALRRRLGGGVSCNPTFAKPRRMRATRLNYSFGAK